MFEVLKSKYDGNENPEEHFERVEKKLATFLPNIPEDAKTFILLSTCSTYIQQEIVPCLNWDEAESLIIKYWQKRQNIKENKEKQIKENQKARYQSHQNDYQSQKGHTSSKSSIYHSPNKHNYQPNTHHSSQQNNQQSSNRPKVKCNFCYTLFTSKQIVELKRWLKKTKPRFDHKSSSFHRY